MPVPGGTMPIDRSMDIELRLLIEAIYLQYSYDFRDTPALR